ncbi:MAG: riboflavin biosynthesis protein RibF [Planctomycetes bacterium]|nr:riboflavin biosynthesis protein RibF [Planctomycetota bacterium]
MMLLRSLREADAPRTIRGGAVTIGNFDGVHLGHVVILRRLVELARECGGHAVVFTFDPHPVRLLRPGEAPPPLTWTERKAELLAREGVDAVIAYPTDVELLALEPESFFERIVVAALGARAIVEGVDFRFGRGRAGDRTMLERLCRAARVRLETVAPRRDGDEPVSSSRIRHLIRAGDVQTAARMLTQPYRIRGMVTHGAQRGRLIGFPTANLAGIDTLLPSHGVYAGRAIWSGRNGPAAIHIGPSPTFGEALPRVEAHLIGFEGSLYGELVELEFLQRIRDIRPFPSAVELRAQLARDIERAEAVHADLGYDSASD